MVNVWLPRSGSGESVTITSNEYVPGVVGVPESVPVVGFKLTPGGRAPELTEKW
jgi:hypothetical protein